MVIGGRRTAAMAGRLEAGMPALLVLYVLGIRGLVHLSLQQLLTPGARLSDFNASNARTYLKQIAAIDSRTVGSPANEILAVNYILDRIRDIQKKRNEVHNITVEVQRPTGSFSFAGGFTYYDHITNIAVKLEPARGAQHAVLANCHFDSVVNTPGASDDAVSCAVLLEILGSLSSTSVSLKHAIIFLFNGAEEENLQGSHGFITQHPWAKLVRAFINLEAAGVGGKELVFQTGPENPWLVQAYVKAAVHPFVSVVAQEIFQSGIIPSDTDFRIYRDFGKIPGIDLAYIENGYIYHTKYDTADRIHIDSIQRAGDNVLGVLKYLASSQILADSSEYRHGKLVFFDVMGLFVLSYSAYIGTNVNYIIGIVTLLYLSIKCKLEGFCSSYFFAMWVILPLITKMFLPQECLCQGSFYKYIAIYLLGLFFPYIHTIYYVWIVFEMFTPIFGRLDTETPPDKNMAILIVVCTVILLSYFVKFIYLVRSTKKLMLCLAFVSGVTFVLVCSGLFFPYSGDMNSPKPMRIFLQHTTRTFHNLNGEVVKTDSGILVNGYDYSGLSHITPHIPELNDTIKAQCEDAPICGFPHFVFLRKNWYVPAPPPPVSEKMKFKLSSKEEMPWGAMRMNFEVKGPSHMTVYVRPHNRFVLSSWSLGDGIPVPSNGGDYSVHYSHGLQAPVWKFWIEVKGSDDYSDGMVTIAAASHYFFGSNQHSPHLDTLLQRFPAWSFPSSWVSTYDLYIY
ncbi:endoplasmic reticulum metallopeptidase 1-like isoform X2 [Pyxicephalus adspersus]|uniref:endoplasmic reticulum metallopeptidase 1-like isoform X2 n=1 Tax=Pyxicephalus adspersus TaxID=30357 RepID=UPI003B59AB61